jgi:hypothetical protein
MEAVRRPSGDVARVEDLLSAERAGAPTVQGLCVEGQLREVPEDWN